MDNRIAVGEHRAYCVHCGAKNIIKPHWRNVTCSSCGKKGPVEEKPPKKPARKSAKTRKPRASDRPAVQEIPERTTHHGNRMIANTVIAIGVIVLLSMLVKLLTA